MNFKSLSRQPRNDMCPGNRPDFHFLHRQKPNCLSGALKHNAPIALFLAHYSHVVMFLLIIPKQPLISPPLCNPIPRMRNMMYLFWPSILWDVIWKYGRFRFFFETTHQWTDIIRDVETQNNQLYYLPSIRERRWNIPCFLRLRRGKLWKRRSSTQSFSLQAILSRKTWK